MEQKFWNFHISRLLTKETKVQSWNQYNNQNENNLEKQGTLL